MVSGNLKTNSEFRRVFLFWTGMYVLNVVVNAALLVLGNRLSDLATGAIFCAMLAWHYILQPWRSKRQRQRLQQSSGADKDHEENTSALNPPLVEENAVTEKEPKVEDPTEEMGDVSSLEDSDTEKPPSNRSNIGEAPMMVKSRSSTVMFIAADIEITADPTMEDPVQDATDNIVTTTNNATDPEETVTPKASNTPPTNSTRPSTGGGSRMAFLDNVKIFLTFLVVSHHITMGFGGGRDDAWYLVVGMHDNPVFQGVLRNFATLNQSFFMPLFFFLSAYFVPTSFEKKGPEVFRDQKRHRLLIPALLTWATICPICMAIQSVMRQNYDEIIFMFTPGHTWFLLWLLALNWMYTSFCQATTNSNNDQPQSLLPFPSTLTRMTWGFIVCGILMWVTTFFAAGMILFALMPIYFGSLTCDLFMFTMGVLAKRNNWLAMSSSGDGKETTLANRMDLNPWVLRLIVLLEGAALVALVELSRYWDEPGPEEQHDIGVPVLSPLGVPFYIVSGLFCVDMGLALLQLFQQYANTQNSVTRFLSKAAYTVYLIHPVVVVVTQVVYIEVHNATVGEDDQIFYDDDSRASQGGSDSLAWGYVIVSVISQLIVWPLAWLVSQAPYLRTML